MRNNIIGAVTEHWMDKRIRLGKPITLQGNLIRISANDILKLQEYKNNLLGIKISLIDASEEAKNKEKEIW